jgi:sugar phosphate isomerase/epimerase
MFAEAPDLIWQADLAWITRGGADPVAELRRHKSRIVACHIKDIAPPGQCLDEDGWADPGHGVLDWNALQAVMKEAGVKLFVVLVLHDTTEFSFEREKPELIGSTRIVNGER